MRTRSLRKDEQSVLEMNSTQAREFLLKPESYCNIDFPPYLRFGRMLSAVSSAIGNAGLRGMQKQKPRDCERVNYPLLSNKDGRHAWRPLQLIHPALYVSLVDKITAKERWKSIRARFSEFQSLPNFKCLSIPVRSRSSRKDKAAQILHWWQGVEQGSIELASTTHACSMRPLAALVPERIVDTKAEVNEARCATCGNQNLSYESY